MPVRPHVVIVGTGFVGGVTGAVLADFDIPVRCVDINEAQIKAFESGHVPFYEEGLEELVRKGIASNTLSFTTNLREALNGTHLVMITVDTPDNGDGSPNLSKVFAVAEQVMQYAKSDDRPIALIIKSTVPATADRMLQQHLARYDGKFVIVTNPEFLREGSAVHDTLNPDRIIVGCADESIRREVLGFYDKISPSVPRLEYGTAAEPMLVKHGANALLAAKISFINNMAQICEQIGGDIVKVADGIGSDRRIGRQFLDASIGFGGACFPKDVRALAYTAGSVGACTTIFDAIARMNEQQLEHAAGMVRTLVEPGARIAVFGLAFKAGTSDVRTSPAVTIIDKLKSQYQIVATDPIALRYDAARYVQGIELTENLWEAATGADCAAFLTEWPEYREIDLGKLRSVMRRPVLFDGRCLFEPETVRAADFRYSGIGRGN